MTDSNIKLIFFGSPGAGFSAYPAEYTDLVGGLDKSTREYRKECFYSILSNGSRIKYVEYGLTGVGQHGNSRGGRNFGLWIELNGWKIDDLGQKKLVSYIDDFVDGGVVESIGVFGKEPHTKRHYIIFSFDDVKNGLDRLNKAFVSNFMTEFKEHLSPIEGNEKRIVHDLIVREKPVPKKTQHMSANGNDNKHVLPQTHSQTGGNENSTRPKNTRGSRFPYKPDLHKILTLASLALIFFLLLLHARHVRKVNHELIKINKLLGNVPLANAQIIEPTTNDKRPTAPPKLKRDEKDNEMVGKVNKLLSYENSKKRLVIDGDYLVLKKQPFVRWIQSDLNTDATKIRNEKIRNRAITDVNDFADMVDFYLFVYTKISSSLGSDYGKGKLSPHIRLNNMKYFSNMEEKIKHNKGSSIHLYLKTNTDLIDENIKIIELK